MKLFRFLILNSRKVVISTILLGIAGGAINTLLIGLLNANLRRDSSTVAKGLMWGFFGLCVVLPITRYMSETLLSKLGQDSLYKLRMQLTEQILAAPLRNLEALGKPRILASLTDDLLVITNAIYVIPIICVNFAIVVCGLLYMAWLSPLLFLAVLVCISIGVVVYQLRARSALRFIRLAREEGDDLFKHFRVLAEGIKELKLNSSRRRAFLTEVLQPTIDTFRHHNIRGMSIYAGANSWGQTFVFLMVGLIVFVLPTVREISAPTLIGYTIILLYIMTPFQVIINSLPTLNRAAVALHKVEEIGLSLAAEPDVTGTPHAPVEGNGLRRLELVNVTHAYHHDARQGAEPATFMLGPLDLSFSPGEIVFLVGGNGSGKTTLAKLFTGLYTPESGEILLNGEPVTDENREYYRQHFSATFADFHLFDRLIGLTPTRLDERAREYLAQLHLDHKVQIRHGVLSTTELSQGQRKRLALMTAYLEDRPVYVFDEWAADQDPLFKDIFYYKLLPEFKARGKTVLVISHDDKYYGVGDRIIKLDYGQLNDVTVKPAEE